VNAWSRLSPALAELALAFAGLLVGFGVLLVVSALGLATGVGGHARLYGFVWGPAMTAVAALFYRWVSRAVRDMQGGRPGDREHRASPAWTPNAPSVSSPTRLAAFVVGGLAASLVGSFVLGELANLAGFPVEEQVAILEIIASAKDRGAWTELVVLGTAAIVLAPLAEEWLFRGLVFRRLLEVSGRPEAYVLSALAFAVIHWNPAGFLIYTWLGLCFAYTLHRTGKLWTAMAVHAGNNAFAYALLVIG